MVTYWLCKNPDCGKPFKLSPLVTNQVKKIHENKPFCPFCNKVLTYKSTKYIYDQYYLKEDIKRDKAKIKALDVWFKGGKLTYLQKLKREGNK